MYPLHQIVLLQSKQLQDRMYLAISGRPRHHSSETSKNGQCHQRYVEREDERKKGGETTLWPDVKVASDGERDATPTQVFVQ